MGGWVSDLVFTASPTTTNSVKLINDDINATVNDGGWRSGTARLSTLLCSSEAGMWRASSSDHKDVTKNRDEDVAW